MANPLETGEPGATPADDPAAADPRQQRRPWVPIRALSQRHRTRLATHLLSLTADDRYLRFGYAASDEQVGRYVDNIDFRRDEVFGIYNRRLELVAAAHLAYEADPVRPHAMQRAEFGVSVLPTHRGRGFGARLFEHAMLHARNRGVDTLIVHALSENAAMLHIARAAGASVQRDGSESEALLSLPPDDLGSHVGELIGERAASLDYQIKWGGKRLSTLLAGPGEVSAHALDEQADRPE
jgi:GNAT superfamily N-acetyltransferase